MSIVDKARDIAYRAHAGQLDKAGHPYIEHVARVAKAVSDDEEAEAVAWLHDVLEDCPDFADELDVMPFDVIEAVVDLTRHAAVSSEDYYAFIKSNPLALRVKLADIADNSNEERLALLDEKAAQRLRAKYKKALAALGVEA